MSEIYRRSHDALGPTPNTPSSAATHALVTSSLRNVFTKAHLYTIARKAMDKGTEKVKQGLHIITHDGLLGGGTKAPSTSVTRDNAAAAAAVVGCAPEKQRGTIISRCAKGILTYSKYRNNRDWGLTRYTRTCGEQHMYGSPASSMDSMRLSFYNDVNTIHNSVHGHNNNINACGSSLGHTSICLIPNTTRICLQMGENTPFQSNITDTSSYYPAILGKTVVTSSMPSSGSTVPYVALHPVPGANIISSSNNNTGLYSNTSISHSGSETTTAAITTVHVIHRYLKSSGTIIINQLVILLQICYYKLTYSIKIFTKRMLKAIRMAVSVDYRLSDHDHKVYMMKLVTKGVITIIIYKLSFIIFRRLAHLIGPMVIRKWRGGQCGSAKKNNNNKITVGKQKDVVFEQGTQAASISTEEESNKGQNSGIINRIFYQTNVDDTHKHQYADSDIHHGKHATVPIPHEEDNGIKISLQRSEEDMCIPNNIIYNIPNNNNMSSLPELTDNISVDVTDNFNHVNNNNIIINNNSMGATLLPLTAESPKGIALMTRDNNNNQFDNTYNNPGVLVAQEVPRQAWHMGNYIYAPVSHCSITSVGTYRDPSHTHMSDVTKRSSNRDIDKFLPSDDETALV